MAADPVVLISDHSRLAASPKEIAALLGIHPRHVYKAINRGDLYVYKCGMKSRILATDAIAWVKSWPKRGPNRPGPK